uniref:Uncharacterized protein n=1 Tax=Knipowitschia caucasica TaxID=637954 RepID=A0AAV2JM37_KNICA
MKSPWVTQRAGPATSLRPGAPRPSMLRVVSPGPQSLRPVKTSAAGNHRPQSALRFSMSLNDVGQRVDSLCRGLNFIDRTCSDGELEAKTQQLNEQKPCNRKAPVETSNQLFLVPSLTNNSKHIQGLPPNNTLPVPQNPQPNPSPSSNFLKRFLPFSRSSTSTSLQCSDLGSYASHLHMAKSSSTLMGGREPSLVQGDDDVFEEEQTVPKLQLLEDRQERSGFLNAPMCYMDEDADLDGFATPTSEKEPMSPFSMSGDCCR